MNFYIISIQKHEETLYLENNQNNPCLKILQEFWRV